MAMKNTGRAKAIQSTYSYSWCVYPTEQTQIKAIHFVYNEHTAEINTSCV